MDFSVLNFQINKTPFIQHSFYLGHNRQLNQDALVLLFFLSNDLQVPVSLS